MSKKNLRVYRGKLPANYEESNAYVTVPRAAELLRCAVDKIESAVRAGVVRVAKHDGEHVVRASDLRKLGRVRLSGPDDGRRAVMLRPPVERYERWEAAAEQLDKPVSTWLSELADAACK